MKRPRILLTAIVLLVLAGGGEAQSPGRWLLVTVEEPFAEPLTAAEFDVQVDNKPAEVLRLYQPPERPVRLALLIDDSTGPAVSGSLEALGNFLHSLPADSEVMVGYLRRGKLISAQPLTSDLEVAAASLRSPSNIRDAGPADLGLLISETLALFPDEPPARAQILYVGEGSGQDPRNDSRLDRAIRQAQQRGIVVWAIHVHEPDPHGGLTGTHPDAEAYLARLTQETGGKVFGLSLQTFTIDPHLSRFRSMLDRQYLLEIDPGEEKRGKLRIELRAREISLLYPPR